METIQFIDLGLMDYMQAWEYQRSIHKNLLQAKSDGVNQPVIQHLLFVEHPHVYTLGKSGDSGNMLVSSAYLESIGAVFYRTDRGGDITYHGPGQVVGYPVIDLERLGMGVRQYIHALEEVIILTVGSYGITAGRIQGATGVWLQKDNRGPLRKICAIGVRISRGITMHGFALNVSTDLSYFSHINPCGFTDRGVTSMEHENGKVVDIQSVKEKLLEHFGCVFNVRVRG